jgi:hypothetical protein
MKALRDFLLEPAPPRRPRPAPARKPTTARREGTLPPGAPADATRALPRSAAVPPGVAVLCPPGHAPAVGAAVALLLRRRARAGLVVVWAAPHDARGGSGLAAAPAARRLAATLVGRGLQAHATGMLAVVFAPSDPVQAAAVAARAMAAAGPAPSVLALGRRDPRFDALLREQDRVVVTVSPVAEAALASLAVAGLASVAREVRACRVEPSPLARAVVASGAWVPAAVRRPLDEALRGLEP